MKREYTILVDDREKRPLRFPSSMMMLDDSRPPEMRVAVRVTIRVQKAHLNAGDYCLGTEDSPPNIYTTPGGLGPTVIETKRSPAEIIQNCLDPRRRSLLSLALSKMASGFRKPYLVLDGGPDIFLSQENPHGPLALDSLLRVCSAHKVPVICLPGTTPAQRNRASEFLARLLINGAL